MPIFTELPPLSLYVHIPWCVRKCPYCDFNSHQMKDNLPESGYVSALLAELEDAMPFVQDRPLTSIFFGGGTPSLFSGRAIAVILEGVASRIAWSPQIEITLEANPGTVDEARFSAFREAGINRLSIGVQSLQDDKLRALGRIHNQQGAMSAIERAKRAGFSNFNLDLMHGLPNQSIDDAMQDLKLALSFSPTHLSWYQLTVEPNTLFANQPPTLPDDETLAAIQASGEHLLMQAGFTQYEVSAYARPKKTCIHNHHYWTFGDYIGIGAGAHSKLTVLDRNVVLRGAQVKHPSQYLDPDRKKMATQTIEDKDLLFEFMLNALRITEGVPTALFVSRTGLPLTAVTPMLNQAKARGLLAVEDETIKATALGRRFLNDLIMMFLADD